jgi:hypothetical protein
MRKQEEWDWNCKVAFSVARGGVSPMGIARSLQNIRQGLVRLEGQGKAEGFFNNAENADKLNGAVEDIRDAMMEYQVCVHDPSAISIPDVRTRLRYSKTSTTRIVNSL